MSKTNQAAEVRLAKIGDSPGIANVHLNSWQEAYSGLLPAEFLQDMPLTFHRRMKFWNELIGSPPQGERCWVAESPKHGIVGFAAVCPARDKQYEGYGEVGSP